MILWLDTETTGYNPLKHGIVELAMLLEIPEKGIQEVHLRCNPQDVEYTDGAFEVNKVSKSMAETYTQTARQAVTDSFLNLRKIVETEGKKFVIAGYNVQFDVKFYQHLVKELGGDVDEISEPISDDQKYIDVYRMAKAAMVDPKATENHKLATMLDYFEVEHNKDLLHTALGDISYTRDLYHAIQKLEGGKK